MFVRLYWQFVAIFLNNQSASELKSAYRIARKNKDKRQHQPAESLPTAQDADALKRDPAVSPS